MEKFVQIQSVGQTFDTKKGKFVAAGDLHEKRYGHSGTLLKTGSDVVIADPQCAEAGAA